MKRLISYVLFASLTGLTAISSLPVVSGGCSGHMNKKTEIKCAEDDTDCQTEKAEKIDLNKALRS